jgi:5'-methylthioadenosine phosphorylase
MSEKRIGIIGGSGLYEIEGMAVKHIMKVNTPFGEPSEELNIGELEGRDVVFLSRHGHGHRILPSEINYRANIWAMKSLGVEWILSLSAVGSFKKKIRPLDIVLVDQFVDRTNYTRESTFFGDGIAAHIMFAHPVCNDLMSVVYEAGQEVGEGTRIHWGGTYLNIEGPAFSTKAESHLYKSWDLDVIGMTNLTEAKLAREAEICYTTIAMVTDYDCWIEGELDSEVSVDMVLQNLNANAEIARKIVRRTIGKIPEVRSCECASALQNAIITKRDSIPDRTKKRLELLLSKYIG